MKVLLVLAAVLGGWAANAQIAKDLSVCVVENGTVPADLKKLWKTELERILGVTGHRLLLQCGANAVEVRFQPSHEADRSALGAARTSRGKVLPKIELYVNQVADLIGTNLPGLLGTALARVTAHELAHYVTQECRHHKQGSLAAYYNPGVLLAASPKYFSLPAPAAD